MIFRRKVKQLPKREIEFRINIVEAQAMHIKRTGSYILQLDHQLPSSELQKMSKQLRDSTGAKWVIVQAGATVLKCGCNG